MNSSFEKCNICKSTNMIQIYESENSKSLTTMNELIDVRLRFFIVKYVLIYIQNH